VKYEEAPEMTQLRLMIAMEKWKSRSRILTFPLLSKPVNTKGDNSCLIP
jgi:hypothetical protein